MMAWLALACGGPGSTATPVPPTPTPPSDITYGTVIPFSDEMLLVAVNAQLGRPARAKVKVISCESLHRLRLTAGWGITNLYGLEYCKQLQYFTLLGNKVTDISPIALLPELKELALQNNRTSDISPLVENSGIGQGDSVALAGNRLDLSEGSQALADVRALRERGVRVSTD